MATILAKTEYYSVAHPRCLQRLISVDRERLSREHGPVTVVSLDFRTQAMARITIVSWGTAEAA